MMYDVIIIGWWASGLFASIFLPQRNFLNSSSAALDKGDVKLPSEVLASSLPKEMKKLILEKNDKCGAKLLLSGGERCNVSNNDINPDRDYVGQNIKSLHSVFHAFSNQDMIDFLTQHGIETVVEDNGRVILKSWKAKQLLDLLMKLAIENGVEIKNSVEIKEIASLCSQWPDEWNETFKITTNSWEFFCKKLIIATWGKSFPQVGATWFAYELAKQFGIDCIQPYQCLCGIETVQDMSGVTWNSALVQMQIRNDKKKCLYDQKGSVLFTHRWISGPVVFNSTLRLWNDSWIVSTNNKIKIIFDMENLNKKLINFFHLDAKNSVVELDMKWLRPWEEAKVSGGGVILSELKSNFESKKIPGLYFIGEACDVVGKTWWYNLQWARSSANVCSRRFE